MSSTGGKICVFFVHGNGIEPLNPESHDWWRDDIGVGLKDGLDPQTMAKVHLSGTYFGDITARAEVNVANQPPIPVGAKTGDIEMRDCRCCVPGFFHKAYSSAIRTVSATAGRLSWWAAEEMRDVRAYRSDADVRARVVQRVSGDIRRVKPDVVFGHSLGTVVAIDALATMADEFEPKLVVTAGSPLSLPMFQSFDGPTADWIRSNDTTWINLVDTSDVVTGGLGLDSGRYPTAENVSVNNDRYARWSGPHGGWGASHSARFYARHWELRHVLESLVRGS